MFGFPMQLKLADGRYIVMRPLTPEEMPDVARQISSYEVCRHLTLRGAQNTEQELEWLKARYTEPNSFGWGICLAEDKNDLQGRPVGMSGVNDITDFRGESGVVLWDRSVWRTGIASAIHRARCYYAVNCNHLVAIDSGCDQANAGSRRALQKVGYEVTGVNYNRGYADGEICHVYQLLWVNPTEHVWNYFWADSEPPKKFKAARKRAVAALEQAKTEVTFL